MHWGRANKNFRWVIAIKKPGAAVNDRHRLSEQSTTPKLPRDMHCGPLSCWTWHIGSPSPGQTDAAGFNSRPACAAMGAMGAMGPKVPLALAAFEFVSVPIAIFLLAKQVPSHNASMAMDRKVLR